MAASMVRQGRNLRSGRFRNRHESESEIRLDFAKEPRENVREILHHIVLKNVCPKAKKLGYLNCFVRLIHYVKKSSNSPTFGFTTKEILSCLRLGLLDEAKEVRAATLRVLRHLLLFDDTLDTLLFLRLDYFIARCLDTCLDNEIERIHAVKLIRRIIQVAPHKLPSSFVFPLISIGNDGASERDRLLRASLATICEIAISNISLMSRCGGLNCLLQSILDSYQYPRLNESLVCTVLYLLNHPRTRHYIRANTDLERLLAPFTDCHFRYSGETDHHQPDDREARFIAVKMALVCMMRSWPGLIRLCHPEGSGLQSLIGILYLPYHEIRKNIMESLFDLFRLTVPQWTSDFATALVSIDHSETQETWRLSEGFVVEEGRAVLPHLAKTRTNLVENHLALILSAWISAGVLEALTEVVISSEGALFTRAVILLGELLHLAYRLLPPETSSHTHCLPSLITMASSFEIPLAKRHQASVAVTNLTHFHTLKKRGPIPHSLFLDQLLQHAGKFVEFVSRHWHLKRDSLSELYFTKTLAEELVAQAVRDTQILNRDFKCWDWDLIGSLLKWPDEKLRRLDDQNVIRLVKKLIYFYKPTNDQFSRMDFKCDSSRMFCKVGCQLIDFLIKCHQEEAQKHIVEWLTDIAQCLYELSTNRVAPESIFGVNSVHHSLSQYYFLFIGRFSLTPRGERFLEKTGIFQNLLDLIGPNTQDIYIKLAVASLNYSRDGSARTILSKALTASSETGRVYCTRFLRILLRTGVGSFSLWGIEFLVTQLYDPSQMIAGIALNILDEASEINDNLESLIKLRPSLLHLGDLGVMMLCRFLSVSKGFKSLMDSNFVVHELEKWSKGFNTKYVQIVEELLNEALTTYEKTYKGSFTRRSIQKHPKKDVFLPIHLYGQLTMHEDGFEMLKKEECILQYMEYVRSLELLSDEHILKLKTALWSLGHLGISVEGVTFLDKETLIPEFIRLAEECGVFSIRGTAFYVLGLLASTRKGTEILAKYGWESMCRTREDLWPVLDEGGCYPFQYSNYLADSCSSFHSAFKADGDRIMTGSTQLSFIEEEGKGDNLDQNCSCDKTDLPARKSLNIPILVNNRVPVPVQQSLKELPSSRTLQAEAVEFQRFHSVKSNSETLNAKSQQVTHAETVNSSSFGIDKNVKTTSVATTVITNLSKTQNQTISTTDNGVTYVNQSQGSESEMSHSDHRKENKFTFTVGSMSPDTDSKGQEKFSFKLGGNSVVREDRSSSEGSHKSKSRTSSFNTDSTTSGISSCDSGLMPTLTVSPLSPIASASSLNTIPVSVHYETTDKVHPSTFNRRLVNLTRVPSLRRRSAGINPNVETGSMYTSYRDAVGYATLRIIKRQRTYSSEGEGDTPTSLFAEPLITRTCSTESDSSVDNVYLSVRSNVSSASLADCDVQQTGAFRTLNTAAMTARRPTNRFIGLALPVDVHMIFEVVEGEDQRSSVSAKDEYAHISNRLSVRKGSLLVNIPPLKYDSVLEHQADICLVCRRNRQSQKSDHEEDYIRDYNDIPPIDCDSDGGTDRAGGSPRDIRTSRPRGESIMATSDTPGSGTSETSSDTAPKKLSEDTPEGRTMVRKEILRLVVSLSSSVGLKGSEQALLTLKQKFPRAFQDLCFYSDVSDLLASYSFRLLARRFVQELFDDFDITLILEDAKSLLGITDMERNGNLASVPQENLNSFPESFR